MAAYSSLHVAWCPHLGLGPMLLGLMRHDPLEHVRGQHTVFGTVGAALHT